jgi:hypothetical protein
MNPSQVLPVARALSPYFRQCLLDFDEIDKHAFMVVEEVGEEQDGCSVNLRACFAGFFQL